MDNSKDHKVVTLLLAKGVFILVSAGRSVIVAAVVALDTSTSNRPSSYHQYQTLASLLHNLHLHARITLLPRNDLIFRPQLSPPMTQKRCTSTISLRSKSVASMSRPMTSRRWSTSGGRGDRRAGCSCESSKGSRSSCVSKGELGLSKITGRHRRMVKTSC